MVIVRPRTRQISIIFRCRSDGASDGTGPAHLQLQRGKSKSRSRVAFTRGSPGHELKKGFAFRPRRSALSLALPRIIEFHLVLSTSQETGDVEIFKASSGKRPMKKQTPKCGSLITKLPQNGVDFHN